MQNMIDLIKKCHKCNLCNNQLPLLDKGIKCDVMFIGLSSKKVNDIDKSIPLDNDTESGKIIEEIEKRNIKYKYYHTNLVKCLPLNNLNKLRYPTDEEMLFCLDNLIYEINYLKPKIIFLLGNKVGNFLEKKLPQDVKNKSLIFKIKHPSYIYVYKRNMKEEYINEVLSILKNNIL